MRPTAFAILLSVLLFAIPALAGDDHSAAAQALYDAWFARHGHEIRQHILTVCLDPRCRRGGKPGNPERTDPAYKAWKQLRTQVHTYDELTRRGEAYLRDDVPEAWARYEKAKGWSSLDDWSKENVLRFDGHWSQIQDGPPPEGWVSNGVDDQGRAVDAKGNLSTGDNDWWKHFWLPLILGLLVGVWVSLKGAGNVACGWAFVGTVAVYGYLTDPWAVFASFVSVYILLLMVAYFGLKTILTGLGIGGKK
jgi:hypothetical protein